MRAIGAMFRLRSIQHYQIEIIKMLQHVVNTSNVMCAGELDG